MQTLRRTRTSKSTVQSNDNSNPVARSAMAGRFNGKDNNNIRARVKLLSVLGSSYTNANNYTRMRQFIYSILSRRRRRSQIKQKIQAKRTRRDVNRETFEKIHVRAVLQCTLINFLLSCRGNLDRPRLDICMSLLENMLWGFFFQD